MVNVKNRIASLMNDAKARASVIMATAAGMASMSSAQCLNIQPANVNANVATNPDQVIGQILGIILYVPSLIGAALLIWGFVMFALSIKNDEPESKQKALMTVFAGVILLALRSILKAAGIIS